jgi:hypothetical protein
MPPYDKRKFGNGRHGACVQAKLPGHQIQRLQKHAVVEPASKLKFSVDYEKQCNWRIKKIEILGTLLGQALLFVSGNLERVIQAPAARLPAACVGFEIVPADLVIIVFTLVLPRLLGQVGALHVQAEFSKLFSEQDVRAPWLDVRAARCIPGDIEHSVDQVPVHIALEESPNGVPAGYSAIDVRGAGSAGATDPIGFYSNVQKRLRRHVALIEIDVLYYATRVIFMQQGS